MPYYTVHGVDRESQLDSSLVVFADDESSARVKANLRGLIVTRVGLNSTIPSALETPVIERRPASASDSTQNRWSRKRIVGVAVSGLLLMVLCTAVFVYWTRRPATVHGRIFLTLKSGEAQLVRDEVVGLLPRFTKAKFIQATSKAMSEGLGTDALFEDPTKVQSLRKLVADLSKLPPEEMVEATLWFDLASETLKTPTAAAMRQDRLMEMFRLRSMVPWLVVCNRENTKEWLQTVSNADAEYAFPKQPPGHYLLVCMRRASTGTALWAVPVHLRSGSDLEVNLTNSNAKRIHDW